MKLTSIIIKILLLFILTAAVFIGVRLFSGDQKFAAALDDWLDQFQEQVQDDESEEDSDDEGEDEGEDDDDVPSRVEIYQGLPAVRLDEDVVSRSGIKVSSLEVATHRDEAQVTGQVIDFQSLLQKRAEFDNTKSDLLLAQTSLNASTKVYERLRVLHKERANVSLRQVEEARFRLSEDKAKIVAINQQIKNIRIQTTQTWGSILTASALGIEVEKENSFFDRLLQNQDVLILVTLPAAITLSKNVDQIFINTQPDRATAQKAYLISSASHTNSVTRGTTYYFRTAAENLRINMRLIGWLTLSDQIDSGVNVPLSSVIWYGGQPWVYVKVTDELYSRRPVSQYHETDSGWFISNTFDLDEKIVTQGSQLLLSEELRWQIPDEDDD